MFNLFELFKKEVIFLYPTSEKAEYRWRYFQDKFPTLFLKANKKTRALYTIFGAKWIFEVNKSARGYGITANTVFIDDIDEFNLMSV